MDIFDEADAILQGTQEKQRLEKIIAVQRNIIEQQSHLLYETMEHSKIVIQALIVDGILTPEQEEIVKPLHFAPTQLFALNDQLNAAKAELTNLEG